MTRYLCILIALIGATACQALPKRAETKLNPLFSDNMVLQQGTKAPVWGTASDGVKITVHFQGQTCSTAAAQGRWRVDLQNLKPGGPFEMTVEGGNKIVVSNILVGEVWVGSGQSNMTMQVAQCREGEAEAAKADCPDIRYFNVKIQGTEARADAVEGHWEVCTPKAARLFSAVCYFFGRDLHKARHVPVGLIHSSVGATAIETWMSEEAISSDPRLRPALERRDEGRAEFAKRKAQYEKAKTEYDRSGKEKGAKEPQPPQPPNTSRLYYGMIAPLQPFAIKGVLWYQGESDAGGSTLYTSLFPAMIQGWRKDWGQGDFPFLFVQITSWGQEKPKMKNPRGGLDKRWPPIREAQAKALALKNTGMAVTIDVGDREQIHAPDKEPVGARLALAGRAIAYGEKIAYQGPMYESSKIQGREIVVKFKYAKGGLVAKGGAPRELLIVGEDRRFVPAKGRIEKDTLVVWSPDVRRPVAMRYAWKGYAEANLYNKSGLPAAPFRTDNFPPDDGSAQGQPAQRGR